VYVAEREQETRKENVCVKKTARESESERGGRGGEMLCEIGTEKERKRRRGSGRGGRERERETQGAGARAHKHNREQM